MCEEPFEPCGINVYVARNINYLATHADDDAGLQRCGDGFVLLAYITGLKEAEIGDVDMSLLRQRLAKALACKRCVTAR